SRQGADVGRVPRAEGHCCSTPEVRRMDPVDKLAVARHLASRAPAAPDEACRRSACSRAYYAAFLVAHGALQQAGFAPPTDRSVHQWVISALKASADADVRALGGDLDTIKHWRNKADYDMAQAWPRLPYDTAINYAE